LEDAGFEVIEADSADEALMWLEVRNGVRAIVTDIHMPGSPNGLDLAAWVIAAGPGSSFWLSQGARGQVRLNSPEADASSPSLTRAVSFLTIMREMITSAP
jgi:two-component system, response regulator PdtaR